MFKPVNRYILIDIPKKGDRAESLIVRFKLIPLAKLVVDRSMIEEISVGGTIYNVILDNYVVGMNE